MITFGPEGLPGSKMYYIFNATLAPRPVAWVSTLGLNGVANLAPHSYCNIFASEPPIVGFVSVGEKDSLRNCRDTGEFVYQIGSYDMAAAMNISSANLPPEESEFDWSNLEQVPSDLIAPPRVAISPVAFECKVRQIEKILESDSYLILGEVLRGHVDESVLTDGRVDPFKIDPVLRMAGSDYARIGTPYTLHRPTWQGLQQTGYQPGDEFPDYT